MSIRLVATDMDGTFLREDKTYDRTHFHHIRQQLKAQGIAMVIASGNSYHQLKLQFAEEDMDDLYFIGDNGNFMVHNGEVLRVNGISRSEFLEVTDYLATLNDQLNVYISTGKRSYVISKDPEFQRIARIYNGVVVVLDDFCAIPADEVATKIAIIAKEPLDPDDPLLDELQCRFPDLQAMTSGNIFVDIIPAGGGKGSGIQLLQEKLNISPAETMVFGDQMNDASMMEVATFSMAMANAVPQLLPYATYQIGTNEEQSVLSVLDQVLADPTGDALATFKYQ
ncbi:MAG: HAD family hydrolase [Aerococcus sp.]|nr:HAD family hydrolase [Aerococcus sp.]